MNPLSKEDIDKMRDEVTKYDFSIDVSFNNATWIETRTFLPRRCLFSKRWIMPGNKIIKGTRGVYINPLEHYRIETFWVDPVEFTLQKLKGNI